MKLNSLDVVFLLLLLFQTPFLLAKRGKSSKKTKQGSTSNSRQNGQNNKGGYPGGAGHQGNHYLSGASTYGRGYGGHGGDKPQSNMFGRSAAMAAGGGAIAGMAVGYGLGSFPRPHFQFHNAQEEYYYNQYMYMKYSSKPSGTNSGTKSGTNSGTNDYNRDNSYSSSPQTYGDYMDSCMKRTDLLPTSQKPENKPAVSSKTSPETTELHTVASAANDDTMNNTGKTNNSAAEASAASTSHQPKASTVPPASLTVSEEDDDDTVSIVDIGYPALIQQVKVRQCVELYIEYSESFRMKQTGGVQGLKMGFQWLLAVVFSTVLMLINSNVLMSMH